MELVATLWVLYVAQCLIHLPRGSALFRGRRAPSEGPGWRFTALWPSAPATCGERLPWMVRDGEPYWRGVASRMWAMDVPGARAAGAIFDPRARAEPDGTRVVVDGSPQLRCMSTAGAEAVARVASRGLADAVAALLERESSIVGLRARVREIDEATRWLRPTLDVLAISLLGVLPFASFLVGIEPVLWRMAPILGGLQVLGVVLFGVAHRRLLPGSAGALALALFEVSVYPPALLRGYQKLRTEGLGRRHPAAIAVTVLGGEAGHGVLRRELVRAGGAEPGPLREAELQALEGIAHASGTSTSRLLTPPRQVDPKAVAYCPACLCEFGRPGVTCSDCRIDVVPFAGS